MRDASTKHSITGEFKTTESPSSFNGLWILMTLRRRNRYSQTMTGWLYILECSDGSYYVGSTRNLERRLHEHSIGEGAKYTQRRRPVRLAFADEFNRIDDAFYAEKQVQGWSRAKRKALIERKLDLLPELARKIWNKPTGSG